MEPRRPPEYRLEISADRSSVKDVVKGILHTIFFHRYFTPLYPATHDVLDLTLPYVSEDEIDALVDARATALVRQLELAAAAGPTTAHLSSPSSSPRPSSSAATRSGPNASAGDGNGRGTLVVQFLEKKRRKGWFVAKADEETVWECWVVDVTMVASAVAAGLGKGSGGSSGVGGGGVSGSGNGNGGGGGGATATADRGGGKGGTAGLLGTAFTTPEREEARTRRTTERSLRRAMLQIIEAVNRERAHIPPITTNDSNPFPYQILVNPKPESWGHKMGIF